MGVGGAGGVEVGGDLEVELVGEGVECCMGVCADGNWGAC